MISANVHPVMNVRGLKFESLSKTYLGRSRGWLSSFKLPPAREIPLCFYLKIV